MSQHQYSNELDPAILATSRSFTTLSVRVHKNDARAQKTSKKFAKEWKRIIGDMAKFDVNLAQGPAGHFSSLAVPECPPGRLAFATRAFDYITAVDGKRYHL